MSTVESTLMYSINRLNDEIKCIEKCRQSRTGRALEDMNKDLLDLVCEKRLLELRLSLIKISPLKDEIALNEEAAVDIKELYMYPEHDEEEEKTTVVYSMNDTELVSSAPIDDYEFDWFCAKLAYDIEDYITPLPKLSDVPINMLSEIFGNAKMDDCILVGGGYRGRGKQGQKNGRGRNPRGRIVRRGTRGGATNGLYLRERSSKMPIINTPFVGLPQEFHMDLLYNEGNYQFGLSAVDTFQYTSISLNDPFDPYTALTGKSANDFLRIMSVYKFCRVKAARIGVRIVNANFASQENIKFAMFIDPTNTAPTNMDDIISLNPRFTSVCKSMPNIIGTSLMFNKSWTMNSALGISALQYSSAPPEYGYDVINNGSTVSSPTKIAYVNICWGRENTSRTEIVGIVGDVTIRFKVKFYTKFPSVEASFLKKRVCYAPENRRPPRTGMYDCINPRVVEDSSGT